jgi:hypothetical protein
MYIFMEMEELPVETSYFPIVFSEIGNLGRAWISWFSVRCYRYIETKVFWIRVVHYLLQL